MNRIPNEIAHLLGLYGEKTGNFVLHECGPCVKLALISISWASFHLESMRAAPTPFHSFNHLCIIVNVTSSVARDSEPAYSLIPSSPAWFGYRPHGVGKPVFCTPQHPVQGRPLVHLLLLLLLFNRCSSHTAEPGRAGLIRLRCSSLKGQNE